MLPASPLCWDLALSINFPNQFLFLSRNFLTSYQRPSVGLAEPLSWGSERTLDDVDFSEGGRCSIEAGQTEAAEPPKDLLIHRGLERVFSGGRASMRSKDDSASPESLGGLRPWS